jgi:hypothetical protein
MPHGSILPTSFVRTSKGLTTTPDESFQIKEAYNLDYAFCFGSLFYMFYTRSYIRFSGKDPAKYSRQPGEKHLGALIHLLHYTKQHEQLGFTKYPATTKSPIYPLSQDNNITPSRNMFTLCDSRWDDNRDTLRSTGGFLIFYQGGVVHHLSNMSEPVVMSSAELEYNEACMTCMAMSHVHMTLNHNIEEVEH